MQVDKVKLIAALKSRRERIIQRHAEHIKNRPRIVAAYKQGVVAALAARIAAVEDCETAEEVYRCTPHGIGGPYPLPFPRRPNTAPVDALLKQLALTDEKAVLVELSVRDLEVLHRVEDLEYRDYLDAIAEQEYEKEFDDEDE